jgi:hypothetical protein
MTFLERIRSNLNLAVLLKDDLSPDKMAFSELYLDVERKKRELIRNSTGHFLLIDLPEGKQTISGSGYYYSKGTLAIEVKQGKVYLDNVLVDTINPVKSITLNPKSNYPFPEGATVIIGKILDEDYKPVEGVRIEVTGFPLKSTTSEPEGGFFIRFDPADGDRNITLTFNKDGYNIFENVFLLKKDTPTRIGTIMLIKN